MGGGVGVGGRRAARGCGGWERLRMCREERWRARDHDGIIRRRPRTLRSRAARGARGKMVAVNPIHFVMALGGGREGRAGVGGGWGVGWGGWEGGGGCEGRGCKRSVPAGRVGRWRRRARLQDERVGWCGLCAKAIGWEKRRLWRCIGGIQVGLARARQQKAFHTGPSYGAVSRKISCFGVDHHRAADCKGGGAGCSVQRAGWMQGAGWRVQSACRVRAVRAGRPPSETRRRVCHFSSGDQHRSSKKGFLSRQGRARLWQWGAVRGRCEGGAVGEASVKARYLHGVSARHRSWYEWIFLGLQGGAGQGQGAGGAGRGRLFGARDGACCTCVREGRRRAKAVHSPAAVGAGWTEGPEERGRGCGAAPGERAEEG